MAQLEDKDRLEIVETTVGAMADAFTEWDRRYRESPELFMSEVEHLLGNTPESYGEACAAFLRGLLDPVYPS